MHCTKIFCSEPKCASPGNALNEQSVERNVLRSTVYRDQNYVINFEVSYTHI